MSQGPQMWVYGYRGGDSLTYEDKQRMKDLMEAAEFGHQDERLAVAEQLNRVLKSDSGYLFGHWNWKPGQEVEEYDDLVEYYKLYAKILANETLSIARVVADHVDAEWFYIDHTAYELSDEDGTDTSDFFKRLELKLKVKAGEEAKERLEEFDQGEGESAE